MQLNRARLNRAALNGRSTVQASAVLPGLFANQPAFYPQLVTPGAVTLDAGLFTNTPTHYAPTLTTGNTLTASGYNNASVIYSPAMGLSNAVAPLFTNASSFFTSAIDTSKTLAAPLFTNTQSYFTQTVAPGAVSLFPVPYTNSSTFFAAAVANGGTFSGSLSDADIERIVQAVLSALNATPITTNGNWPTALQNASAVVAAFNSNKPSVNVATIKDKPVIGSGTREDPWRPA